MYKEMKAIYDSNRKDIFAMSVSHALSIGLNNAVKITDEDLAAVKDQGWATADFLRAIMKTAREIAGVCLNNPVELIQFCMTEDVFDTTYYAPAEKRRIPWERMSEIATNAIWGLHENGGDWEEELEEADLDLDEGEMEFFGIDYEEED